MSELYEEFNRGQNKFVQNLEVEFVREKEASMVCIPTKEYTDSDKSVEKETPFNYENGNEIYGNNNSPIVEVNLDVNNESIRTIEKDQILETNAKEIELRANWQKVMFGNYYQIIELKGNKLIAACKNCKSIIQDVIPKCPGTRQHLKVRVLICEVNEF